MGVIKVIEETETVVETIIEKPSRAERIMRSIAARLRRKEVKEAKNAHTYKEEKDARERLQAKRNLEKQKKRRRTGSSVH
jgi:hypothetical protein